jgi:hypothetical protein
LSEILSVVTLHYLMLVRLSVKQLAGLLVRMLVVLLEKQLGKQWEVLLSEVPVWGARP